MGFSCARVVSFYLVDKFICGAVVRYVYFLGHTGLTDNLLKKYGNDCWCDFDKNRITDSGS